MSLSHEHTTEKIAAGCATEFGMNSLATDVAPSLAECVREDLECICGVHGYKLHVEFDYVCDTCGHANFAEFKSSPARRQSVDLAARKRVQPKRLMFGGMGVVDEPHDYRPT